MVMFKATLGRLIRVAMIGGSLLLALGAQGAVTPFSADVGSSIDMGLAWQDANGAYTGSAGDATGLSLLALLQKRTSADPSAVNQGYALASPADKARMDSAVAFILANHVPVGFYAYRDGADMMALSVYLTTGGPNAGVPAAINTIFDRAIANQEVGQPDDSPPWPAVNGYWCYFGPGCRDSSTTQFVVAGLAAVRSVYIAGAHADATRLAKLDAAAALSRTAYQRNGIPDFNNLSGGCSISAPNEKGHGYNAGSTNTLQQTGSGTWIQLVGGATVNDADVQAYLRWLLNRYNYDGQRSEPYEFWPSYWYYLWTTAKAFEFIASGPPVAPGNIGPNDFGLLPPASAPACDYRQLHRNPLNDPRVPLFGAGGPGYYNAEPKRVYYDAAYSILQYQCVGGFYGCNGAPGGWGYNFDTQAYALLVLQRSVGGGCIDSDGDGICNEVDNCPAVANPGQEDANRNGVGDACEVRPARCDMDNDGDIDSIDIRAITALRNRTVPPADARADADFNGIINVNDARACTLRCTRQNCAVQ
jgi:hypothetical protein